MTTLLFYEKPVIIDRNVHRDLRLKLQSSGFRYAAKTNSIPLAAVEFAMVCHEYPIVFILDEGDGGVPVALTGLRDNENLSVRADGKWDGVYIPAFVRRYPFVLQIDDSAEESRVLIDSAADGFGAPDGERLFAEDGANTPLLNGMLDLLNEYRAFTSQTTVMVKHLRKLDLLIPRVVNATLNNGATISMDGFHVVDEARLNALADADLLELARTGHLSSIYAHLISLPNLQKLLERLERLTAIAA
ncbi:hypothetical protein RCH09_003854 [Actimicrobium sp. GrIS 1.19]|uniref:SapC family protein n=1 Tax=Actimicrobium sp. GrIS 1.19 TaxID=3071708 RepID=UPI002E09D08C|nr:hypothetical protein [Actimicrobium sp. GrIS 1.19]